jgi:hypothetical protein
MEGWVAFALADEPPKILRRQKSIAPGRFPSLGDRAHWIEIVLAAADREIECAAQNGAVFVDRRSRKAIALQSVQEFLDAIT